MACTPARGSPRRCRSAARRSGDRRPRSISLAGDRAPFPAPAAAPPPHPTDLPPAPVPTASSFRASAPLLLSSPRDLVTRPNPCRHAQLLPTPRDLATRPNPRHRDPAAPLHLSSPASVSLSLASGTLLLSQSMSAFFPSRTACSNLPHFCLLGSRPPARIPAIGMAVGRQCGARDGSGPLPVMLLVACAGYGRGSQLASSSLDLLQAGRLPAKPLHLTASCSSH